MKQKIGSALLLSTPFSLLIGCVTVLAAKLYEYKHIFYCHTKLNNKLTCTSYPRDRSLKWNNSECCKSRMKTILVLNIKLYNFIIHYHYSYSWYSNKVSNLKSICHLKLICTNSCWEHGFEICYAEVDNYVPW